jgi:hypothetical protein
MWRLQIPWWPDASRGFDWLAGSVTLAQFLLLWLVSRWAGVRGRSFHRALCLVSLSGSIVALWSVSRIIDDILPYLVSWVSVLSMTNLIAIVAVVTCQGQDYLEARGVIPAGRSARMLQRWLPALLVLMVAGYTLPRLAADQRRSGTGSIALKASVGEIQSYLDRHSIRRPVFRIAHEAWPFAAGIILELSRVGRSVAVEPQWIYMYTDAFAVNGGEDAQFRIVAAQGDDVRSRPEYEPVTSSGPVNVYRVLELRTVQGLSQPGRILGASGTRGDPARILDGRVPIDGSRWDSEGVLILEGPQASVTLAVPPTATGVALSADGNDSYRLECSADGSRFEFIGIVPAQPGNGIQTREGHFQGMATCQQLRISPNAGDGLYSIAEVTFLKASVNRGAR